MFFFFRGAQCGCSKNFSDKKKLNSSINNRINSKEYDSKIFYTNSYDKCINILEKIYRLIDTHTRKTLGVTRNRSLIDLDRLPIGETISETSELLKNRNKAVIIVIVGG